MVLLILAHAFRGFTLWSQSQDVIGVRVYVVSDGVCLPHDNKKQDKAERSQGQGTLYEPILSSDLANSSNGILLLKSLEPPHISLHHEHQDPNT